MRPETGPESLRKRASFSKGALRCPARDEVFPLMSGCHKYRKSRANPAASPSFAVIAGAQALESLRTAALAAVPLVVAIAAHHAVTEAAAPPALSAKAAGPVRQDGEAALLAVVQRLVKRIGGIGDLLHGGRRRRHIVGALAQAAHRVIRFLRVIGLDVDPRIGAVDPQFCKLAHRGLNRRQSFS